MQGQLEPTAVGQERWNYTPDAAVHLIEGHLIRDVRSVDPRPSDQLVARGVGCASWLHPVAQVLVLHDLRDDALELVVGPERLRRGAPKKVVIRTLDRAERGGVGLVGEFPIADARRDARPPVS